MKTFQEFITEAYAIEEGMTLKDFKANRRKLKHREASADAAKRGHVGKEWYNSGKKYSPDEAKRMRSNLDDEERRTRHRSAVEPDNENDDGFSADKTKNPKKRRKQEAMGEHGDRNVQELFITKLTPEQKRKQKRKKQVETLIRLMKHANDPSSDVAKTKKEDYELDETIRNPESRKKLRAIMDREVEKGDKSKGQNPRKKYHNKKGNQAFSLLMSRDETGSKGNPVRSRGGTNAPADERVGRGPHRAGNAAYWASVAGPTRDRGAGNANRRRRGIEVPNTRDED